MLKAKFYDPKTIDQWIYAANLFAQGTMSKQEALQSFNQISQDDRIKIKKEFSLFDEYRRASIPKNLSDKEKDDAYCKMVFVDANIIATEYDTTPIAAILCIGMPCSPKDRVIVKGW